VYVYFETLTENETQFCPTLLDFSSGWSQNKAELRFQHMGGRCHCFITFQISVN
jgi:hypothetical protein